MVQVQPTFEVEKVAGKRKHTVFIPKEGGGFTTKEIEIDGGYNVYFPRGHSIRVSEEELKRLGFDRNATLVDMETGERVAGSTHSLKEQVARKTKPTRASAQE